MPKTQKFLKLYHRSSTRYASSNREFLTRFEQLWKKDQPHYQPASFGDKSMSALVRFLRVASDLYFRDHLLKRAVMLEVIAAIPGIVGGFYHHMSSLRKMQHDHWIKITMDEAENERMHLMSLMELYQPTALQRFTLLATQAIFFPFYFALYSLSKTSAHRFVGYLEEEAVKTYSHFIEMIDQGKIKDRSAPNVAIEYWGLPEDATLRDMLLVIRADEADHRLVNHAMSSAHARRDTCQYLEDVELHNPWQADCIEQIQEVKAANQKENVESKKIAQEVLKDKSKN